MLRLVACTLGLSALLLFAVQPMIGRALLPLLGGAPAVWTAVLLFFQAALLAGYAYAHASARWLPWRAQAGAHLLLVAAGLAALPFSTAGAAPPAGDGLAPALWVAGWLTVAVGLPVVALSASAPLLQAWAARAGARDPYPLYAASNAGSLAALVAYPLVVEPLAGVTRQARGWAAGYAVLLALVAACAVVVGRAGAGRLGPAPDAERDAAPVTVRRLARWLALSAVPVALLLGVTGHLTADLSAVPLLWVTPLAVYLVTFIIAFSRPDRAARAAALGGRVLLVLAAPLVVTLAAGITPPLLLAVALDLAVLFAAGLVCHGALAQDRPAVAHLSGFYLVIAAGGALAGALCAVVVPLVSSRLVEYPLALAAACALRPAPAVAPGRARVLAGDAGWALATAAVALAVDAAAQALAPGLEPRARLLAAFGPAAVLAHAAHRRPVRHGVALAALLGAALLVDGEHGRAVHGERSFFGVHRVTVSPDGRHRWLLHGGTVHGAQALDPARAGEPLTYYHRLGPCGDVVAAWRAGAAPRRAGVVGLGVGALAAYAAPDEDWTFFEVDPAVARIARDPRLFTFLRDCRAEWRVVPGDARLRLRALPPGGLGVLFMDAFSGDAVPAHLLTREALAEQAATLAPGGLLAVHVSNRYLDLPPVIARAAAAVGLVGRVRLDDVGARLVADAGGRASSEWVVLARREEDLGPLRAHVRWRALVADGRAPWTDDHAPVLGALAR
ncbi:MAG: fused MFS/spermidine synthase [Planctomycetes bacterium]|nr:fused MFS/spermidine synthase [Planctomycetota bacterium]